MQEMETPDPAVGSLNYALLDRRIGICVMSSVSMPQFFTTNDAPAGSQCTQFTDAPQQRYCDGTDFPKRELRELEMFRAVDHTFACFN